MTPTSKLKFNRRNWVPDPRFKMHRIDIFMVNAVGECPTCRGHSLHSQMLVIPTESGLPWFDIGLVDTGLLTDEEAQWCRDENKALLELFPQGHEFWLHGV